MTTENTLRFHRMAPELYARQAQSGLRTDMMTRAAYTSDASIFLSLIHI